MLCSIWGDLGRVLQSHHFRNLVDLEVNIPNPKTVYCDHSDMIGHLSGIAPLQNLAPNNLFNAGIPEQMATPSKEGLSASQHP
eukprot:3424533-Pyramimonas_sp.AAC.1